MTSLRFKLGRKEKAAPQGERLDWLAQPGLRRSYSGGLDVVDGDLAAAAVLGRVEGNLLTFRQTTQAGTLEGRCMDENVLAAVFRLNEAETLHVVVELHSADHHLE